MANGLFGGGAGTALSPYIIEDALDLNAIRTKLSSYFKLNCHINLSIYNTGTGWVPIVSFTGTLDGGFYSIYNLFINLPASTTPVGLFSTGNGTIKNLGVIGNVTGKSYVGMIFGSNPSGILNIKNCFTKGNMTAMVSYSGSIVGGSAGTCNIKNCYSTVNITAPVLYCGGLIGSQTVPVLYSYYNGTITSPASTSAAIGNLTTNSTCYYNIDIIGSGIKKGTEVGLTTGQMIWNYNFSLQFIYNSNDETNPSNAWIFSESGPPKLWFECLTHILLYIDGSYKTYKNGVLEDVSSTYPTIKQFIDNGVDISTITHLGWLDLRKYNSIELYGYNRYSKTDTVLDLAIYDASPFTPVKDVDIISIEETMTPLEEKTDLYIIYEHNNTTAIDIQILDGEELADTSGGNTAPHVILVDIISETNIPVSGRDIDIHSGTLLNPSVCELGVSFSADLKTRYLLSKDNELTWNSCINGVWAEVLKTDIFVSGMTKNQLELLNLDTWLSSDVVDNKFNLLIGEYSDNTSKSPVIESISLNYEEFSKRRKILGGF